MLEGGRVERGTEEWIVDSERGKIDGKTKEGAEKKNRVQEESVAEGRESEGDDDLWLSPVC